MTSPEDDSAKETFLLHGLSPQLESELVSRALENGREVSAEVADILQKHIEEEDGIF